VAVYAQPGKRRGRADDRRLQPHQTTQLARLGTEAAQQRELASALSKRHRPGGVDDEAADEQRHRARREHHASEDARVIASGAGALGRVDEYERARHEAHADHRREPGQQRPPRAGEHFADTHSEHGAPFGDSRSSTTRPSATTIARSA
jgi:hypothetical protein